MTDTSPSEAISENTPQSATDSQQGSTNIAELHQQLSKKAAAANRMGEKIRELEAKLSEFTAHKEQEEVEQSVKRGEFDKLRAKLDAQLMAERNEKEAYRNELTNLRKDAELNRLIPSLIDSTKTAAFMRAYGNDFIVGEAGLETKDGKPAKEFMAELLKAEPFWGVEKKVGLGVPGKPSGAPLPATYESMTPEQLLEAGRTH